MTPEAYGCLSLALRHLNTYGSSRRWREPREVKHTKKAQKLFAKANRLLKNRGQDTLGDFSKRRVYEIMGQPIPIRWGRD